MISKDKPLVSIIVPIFGVEKYIERCARSLFEQTMDDLEFLFIDDCSPDSSIKILKSILDEYPKRKSQVIIHRMNENSGQAAVRKWGILHASGEYIVHCDSDDWIDTNAYETCYNTAIKEDKDVVFFDFERTDGTNYNHLIRNIPLEKEKIIGSLLSGSIMGSLCGMIVKKSIYNSISVWPKDNLSEDLVLSIQLINNASSFGYIPVGFYKYFVNSSSITAKHDKEKAVKNFRAAYNNYLLIKEFLLKHNTFSKYNKEIESLKCNLLNYLSPYTNDKDIRSMWKHTFSDINLSIIFNPLITKDIKFIYLLVWLRLFTLVQRLKQRLLN